MPMESRRSRKQREVVYQNGIQSNVLKEISTPRPDGSIPLISFLENVNYSIMELYDFNTRISALEGVEKKEDGLLTNLARKEDINELVQSNDTWKEEISAMVDAIETNTSKNLLEMKEGVSKRVNSVEINAFKNLLEMKESVSERIGSIETDTSKNLREIGENISERIGSIETDTSKNLREIREMASKNKFIEIMKMENDISNQYYKIHTKLDDFVNEQCNKVVNLKKPAIRSFSDNLKKRIETKVISFDDLLEATRVELKNNVKALSIQIKTEYTNLISHLTQLANDMNNEIIAQEGDENMSIEIRMKKESCFNNIYIDLKNKYKITQLSLQTLYINIFSEISSMCSYIFGKIEALLQNGSMSDVQLVLLLDDFTDNLINAIEEGVGFELDVKMNHSNREEYEFDLFKQSKKQEKELLNKTL